MKRIRALTEILEKQKERRIFFEIQSLPFPQITVDNINRLYKEYVGLSIPVDYSSVYLAISAKFLDKYLLFIQDVDDFIKEMEKDTMDTAGLDMDIKKMISDIYKDQGVINSFHVLLRNYLSKKKDYDAEEKFKKIKHQVGYLLVGKSFQDFNVKMAIA